VPRQLTPGAATSMPRRAPAGVLYLAAAAAALAAVTGCQVNGVGLDGRPDTGTDAGSDTRTDTGTDTVMPVDLPVEIPPSDGGGPDLGCAPCDSAATFITLPGGRFTGSTVPSPARPSENQGSCGGGAAPEAVFKIELFSTSDLFITTHGTGFDTVVYLRRGGCCGDEVACNDDADGRGTSVIAQRALAAGTYYIYVDGADRGEEGDFTLDVYATPMAAHTAEACGRPERISADPVTGDTCGAQDDYSPPGGCSSAVSGPNGLDQVYYFVLDAPGTVSFNTCTNTCIDTVLYLREVCSDGTGGSVRGCHDDDCRASGSCQPTNNQVQSRVSATLDAGVHYLVLDTFAAAQVACGAFTITPVGVP
jgi:hypothetical protein